jgi:spore maturation protein CgeB
LGETMKLMVFGLCVSSAWGNGHATFWRGLIHALAAHGHSVSFYEQNKPYYAAHRDCRALPNGELIVYEDFDHVRAQAALAVRSADAAIVTSHCPDALAATELVMNSAVPIRAYYDLDTPITLDKLARGDTVPYIHPRGLGDFDVVMSCAGGRAPNELQRVLGARRVAPLYACVDPHLHAPVPPIERYHADLSYLGTYAQARQPALEELLLAPAHARPGLGFAIGGSLYPHDFAWAPNVKYMWHVPPFEHAAFYCSARLNLNVTSAPVAAMGYCPSIRLFEASACGAALISDAWPGLDEFYEPGDEILVARNRDDVLAALDRSSQELWSMAQRARARTLAQHTAAHRAEQLLEILSTAHARTREFQREPRSPLEV